MNKLQSLGRTENFILKLSIQFFKNSELRAIRYQKNIVLFSFYAYRLLPRSAEDSNGTGNEDAATQQYYY